VADLLTDYEAEGAVLAAPMIDPTCWAIVAALDPNVFHAPQHKAWHAAIKVTPNPEIVTVCAWLKEQGLSGECSMDYILRRISISPGVVNLSRHIEIIEDRALRRGVSDRLQSGIDLVGAGEMTGQQLAEKLAAEFIGLTSKGTQEATAELGDVLMQVIDEMERAQETKQINGIPTGFPVLDAMTGGWQAGDLSIIAARPSEGKSALLMQLLVTAARTVKRALFISREMSKKSIARRLLSGGAHIEQFKMRNGRLNDTEWDDIRAVLNRLLSLGITIDDRPYQTLASIRASAMTQKLTKGLDIIGIDYLQLLDEPKERGENREQQIARVSKGIKSLAMELNVPVILLSQMSRGYEKENRRPMLSDLRESGAIEQDADNVLFIHTPGGTDKAEDVHEVELILAKQRNGPTGTVTAEFSKPRGMFTPRSNRTPPPQASKRDRLGERDD
jgi:replicative DNA helicase